MSRTQQARSGTRSSTLGVSSMPKRGSTTTEPGTTIRPRAGFLVKTRGIRDQVSTHTLRMIRRTSVDPLGLYTIAPPRPGHPVTPPPSPALDKLLHCIENRLHISLTVTSTTEGHHQDPGHAAGTTVDIRPPAGISPDKVFCASGQCGAQWGINEGPTGGPTPLTTGFNYHIQLNRPNNPHPKSKDAIPPNCSPGGCAVPK